MKTTAMVILFLMVSLLHDVASAYGDQIVAWRWRNDDGNVYTATWRDSVNTPVVLTPGENIRLRVEDLVTYGGSGPMMLHYSEDPFMGAWFPVTGLDTGKFFISLSVHLSDTASYGDNQLLPPNNPTNIYRRTVTVDSSRTFVLTTEESSIYELEYSIRPTWSTTPGAAYFFTTFRDSALMGGDEYAVLVTPPVHWRARTVGKWCTLNSVEFMDAQTGIAVGSGYTGAVLFRTVDGGTSWISQPIPPSGHLGAVAFADAVTGVAVGNAGTMMRTTDGGQSWVLLKNVGATKSLCAVAFADEDSGAIVGFSDDGSGTVRSLTWRTTNAGETWIEQLGPANRRLYAVSFASVDVGTAVGEAGFMMRTTDGGRSWSSRASGTAIDLRGISYGNVNNGVAVGGGWSFNEGVIVYTADGGSTWKSPASAASNGLYGISMANPLDGWAVGAGGWISKTTDGGATWKRLPSSAYRTLHAVDFVDRENGLVVGEAGGILVTTDGGTTSVDLQGGDGLPAAAVLMQNYPNPFNPTTKIQFTIVDRQWTTVRVFDVLGRDVATLVNEEKQPGTYVVQFDATRFASGIYLYRLISGDVSQTRKMVVLK